MAFAEIAKHGAQATAGGIGNIVGGVGNIGMAIGGAFAGGSGVKAAAAAKGLDASTKAIAQGAAFGFLRGAGMNSPAVQLMMNSLSARQDTMAQTQNINQLLGIQTTQNKMQEQLKTAAQWITNLENNQREQGNFTGNEFMDSPLDRGGE